MKGEVVGGVRIKLVQPKEKVKAEFNESHFENAKLANATIEQIMMKYTITEETKLKYIDYAIK